MAPRKKCPVCGSRQWHKEPASGLITCSEGHVLQNYRNETREVTELGPHAVRKRTLKSRKKKEKRNKADPKLYHGERARFHYFQCLQLILRLQVTALSRLWDLPPDFETVCREIWALHLSLLPNPPQPEPLLHLQDGMGGIRPTRPQSGDARPSGAPQAAEDEREQSDGHNTDESNSRSASPGASSSSTSSTSSDEEDASDRDAELDELMRENSETPSEEEAEDDENRKKQRAEAFAATRKRRKTFGQYDGPASTLSVLVVACWTLRLPVMYVDFIRLVEGYDLPYLDPIRLLPENMTRHLTKHTSQALSPHHAPSTLAIHRLTSRLARLLYSTYEIYTPEMNAAPILWKAVRSLQGTPVLYVLAKKVAHRASIPLTLHQSLSPALLRTKARDPFSHKQDSAVPEVALAACVIIVLKLVYGLDGKSRRPAEENDPACALPTLPEFIRAIKDAEAFNSKHIPAFSMGTETSALDMDDAMMDAYIEFCEKALLPREDRIPARNATTDYFPLPEAAPAASSASPHDEQPHFTFTTANTVNSEEGILKPGEEYPIYNTQDILGVLPDDLELVVSTTARWAGVEPTYVSGVVERFERRIARWWDLLRRKERGEPSTESTE